MRWWCSAGTAAWTWDWQPYPGVWRFVGLLVFGFVVLRRRARAEAPEEMAGKPLWFGLGVACLWVSLDWPAGPLGASYLVSVHMGQFIFVGILAPLLLLLGVPHAAYRRLRSGTRMYRWLAAVTSPVIAFVIFNGMMTATHWPQITDALMVTQLGSFALDMAWLAGGTIFWWPLVAPVPERPKFHPLARLAYLGLNIVIVQPPMLVLFYSEFPVYATYELAPPLFPGASAVDDQQLAAGIMKMGTALIVATAMFVTFRGWFREQRRQGRAP